MNFVFAGHCYAQQPADIGKTEYVVSCASCHGEDGKGAGPVAGFLKQKVADLTVLQKNSGGAFPFSHVYDVIDGREAVAAHGPRNMPVWGDAFNREGAKLMGYLLTTEDLDSFTRGKIIALVGYIYTLQAK
jgi:mono/diheme cytochrome c family protein